MSWEQVEYRLTDWTKKLLPLLIGLVVGALLVKVSASSKLTIMYLMAVSLASIVAMLFVLKIDLTRVLVFAAFFLIPIPFGITLFFQDPIPFYVSANGFDIDLIDLSVVGLLFLRWVNQAHNPQSIKPFIWCKPLLLPALLLLFINTLSASFTPYPFFAFSLVASHVKMIFLLLVVANVLQTRTLVTYAVWGLIGALAVQGLIGVEQKLLGVIFTEENMGRRAALEMVIGQQVINRVAGTLEHPNAFAMFLNLVIPTAIYYIWIEKTIWTRLLTLAAITVAVMAEVFSGSRSGWIALMFAMMVTVPFWLKHRGQNPWLGMAVASVVGALLFSSLFTISQSFRDRLLLDDHGTAEVRYPLMDVAANMIFANPISGVGVNHYTYFMTAYDRTADAISFTYPYPVHNTFLLVAGETGIPALLLIISLFVIAMMLAYKTFCRSDGVVAACSLGLLAALLTMIIHNLGNPAAFFEDQVLWVLMGLIVAMYRLTDDEQRGIQ